MKAKIGSFIVMTWIIFIAVQVLFRCCSGIVDI